MQCCHHNDTRCRTVLLQEQDKTASQQFGIILDEMFKFLHDQQRQVLVTSLSEVPPLSNVCQLLSMKSQTSNESQSSTQPRNGDEIPELNDDTVAVVNPQHHMKRFFLFHRWMRPWSNVT
jgi:hypothetical protein